MHNTGFKLYDDEEPFFSWHPTLEDAEQRQEYEKLFGRKLKIAPLTLNESDVYQNAETLRGGWDFV